MILCCEVNTHFCRETGYVANTRFLAFFLLRFDSDKCDLTQTLLRYLDKKTLTGASGHALKAEMSLAHDTRFPVSTST